MFQHDFTFPYPDGEVPAFGEVGVALCVSLNLTPGVWGEMHEMQPGRWRDCKVRWVSFSQIPFGADSFRREWVSLNE